MPDVVIHPFQVDGFRKKGLLAGQDEIGSTLDYLDAIEAFEARHAPFPGDLIQP